MFPEHVERRFLDPEYSLNEYFQLGSRRNILPIKNGLNALPQGHIGSRSLRSTHYLFISLLALDTVDLRGAVGHTVDWLWCGRGTHVDWLWCGCGTYVDWLWCGCGTHVDWLWCGCGTHVDWLWRRHCNIIIQILRDETCHDLLVIYRPTVRINNNDCYGIIAWSKSGFH